MSENEHTVTLEAERLMDHGVPVNDRGEPSSYETWRPTGQASCSCGWTGTSVEAREHLFGGRS